MSGVLSFHARWLVRSYTLRIEVKNMRVETGCEEEDSLDSGVLWLDFLDQEEFIINTKDACEMELVGGKAFNISKLAREGFAVPEGFCITTKAYDYFMHFNGISGEDEDVGDKIRGGLMPPFLLEILRGAYYTYLRGRPCAVRSSSPAEDLKSASFAGQYKSFLNVQGEDHLDAVKECWASLWSRSAGEYRKRMGIENENVKMAVLVQEMLPAAVSGVLFTEDNMVIEAVWGLGDLLVGGKAIPDHFVVTRDTFNVVEQKISNKEVMSQIASNGVEIVDVPKHLRDIPVLEDNHVQELCSLGKEVEELFGCPQDIEWAVCNGAFILLQARPITVTQEPTVWSRANISEMQPGYITYLSRPPENRPDFFVTSARPLLECFGIRKIPENMKFAEYIYGYIYLNMTNLHNILCKVPGLTPESFDQAVGYTSSEEVPESKLKLTEIIKVLPGTLRVIRFILSLPKQAEEVISYSLTFSEDIKSRNLQDMPLEELDNLVWQMYDINQRVFQVHTCNALAIATLFGFLHRILVKLGEEGTENLLITGLEGMSSYRLGAEMWKLAQSAKKSSRVSELILSKSDSILEELKQSPEGKDFLEKLNEFIGKFGDRCAEEPELSSLRWEEDLSFVFSMVASYLGSHADPTKTMEQEKGIRLETTDQILKKLARNPAEKLIFKKILEKTQEYIVTRENLKTTWGKGLCVMRLLYLAIASKLVDRGILKDVNDIFYLKMIEVSDIIADEYSREQLADLIEKRRKEKEVCEHLNVPMMIVGKPPPIEEFKYVLEPREKLEGTGVRHGIVTGRARVVLGPSDFSEFKEGEILVAPVTDPGWSPLFVIAEALVMELGSPLSHGVIIAREYGIPAVVGVKDATKIIKTGQLITVDGTKGAVYIRE